MSRAPSKLVEVAREARRAELLAVLRACDGNASRAADTLGVRQSSVSRAARALGLSEEASRLRIAAGNPDVGRPRKR